jgi:hypothetical protein
MRVVFVADHWIDAQLARGLLASEGIQCLLLGESLTGAMGELPALGVLRLAVDERDETRARELLASLRGRDESSVLEA